MAHQRSMELTSSSSPAMHKKSDDENGKSGDGSNPDLQKQSPSDPRSAVEKQGCSAETQPLRFRRLLRSLLRNFFEKIRSGGPPQINADCYSRFSATKFRKKKKKQEMKSNEMR